MKIEPTDGRRLDQKVRLERKTEVRDSTGDLVPTWGTLMDAVFTAVDFLPLRARNEAVVGGRLTSLAPVTFWFRADVITRTGLNAIDRIIWQGAIYEIRDMPTGQQPRTRLVAVIAETGATNG